MLDSVSPFNLYCFCGPPSPLPFSLPFSLLYSSASGCFAVQTGGFSFEIRHSQSGTIIRKPYRDGRGRRRHELFWVLPERLCQGEVVVLHGDAPVALPHAQVVRADRDLQPHVDRVEHQPEEQHLQEAHRRPRLLALGPMAAKMNIKNNGISPSSSTQDSLSIYNLL